MTITPRVPQRPQVDAGDLEYGDDDLERDEAVDGIAGRLTGPANRIVRGTREGLS